MDAPWGGWGPWGIYFEDLEVIIDPQTDFGIHNFIFRDEIIRVRGRACACAFILCYEYV